ncbi:hypothetical protein [Pseudomonas sp. REB1044]|uniref:hypothetical protein n=1 Tax=Pseudomonas sp. REB1044 TaxID=2675224 RepID=UPI00315DEF96
MGYGREADFELPPLTLNTLELDALILGVEMLMAAAKCFPGLIDYHAYAPLGGDRVFVDLAMWEGLEYAQDVAKAFREGDARFAEYAHAIEDLTFMSHFAVS